MLYLPNVTGGPTVWAQGSCSQRSVLEFCVLMACSALRLLQYFVFAAAYLQKSFAQIC